MDEQLWRRAHPASPRAAMTEDNKMPAAHVSRWRGQAHVHAAGVEQA